MHKIEENFEEDIVLEDKFKKVVIGRKNGLLKEYCVNGKNYIENGAFEPLVYEDNEDPWGWDIDVVGKNPIAMQLSKGEKGIFAGCKNVRIVEQGDVLTEIECLFENESSFVKISYKVYNNTPFVDINVYTIWNEKSKALKLKIPTTLSKKCLIETAYGVNVLDCENKERPMHRFVAKIDNDKAFAIYNNCIFSTVVDNKDIYLTLLNGSAYCAHPIGDRPMVPPDRFNAYIEQGKHTFSFRLAVDRLDELGNK